MIRIVPFKTSPIDTITGIENLLGVSYNLVGTLYEYDMSTKYYHSEVGSRLYIHLIPIQNDFQNISVKCNNIVDTSVWTRSDMKRDNYALIIFSTLEKTVDKEKLMITVDGNLLVNPPLMSYAYKSSTGSFSIQPDVLAKLTRVVSNVITK